MAVTLSPWPTRPTAHVLDATTTPTNITASVSLAIGRVYAIRNTGAVDLTYVEAATAPSAFLSAPTIAPGGLAFVTPRAGIGIWVRGKRAGRIDVSLGGYWQAAECIRSSIAGGEKLVIERAAALGQAAGATVERYAPNAPQAVKNEAVIRIAGWLHSRRPNPMQRVSLGGLSMDFRERFYSPNALTNSGARALLTPWRTRRALPVEDAS